jgi:hypothetical protein
MQEGLGCLEKRREVIPLDEKGHLGTEMVEKWDILYVLPTTKP